MPGYSDLDQFDVDIRHDKDSVVAAIPELGLFARGDTGEAALAALAAKKRTLEADLAAFRNLKSNGAATAESDMGPAGDVLSADWRSSIRPFAMKAGIVFLLIVAGVTFATIQVQQIVDSAIVSFQSGFERFAVRGGTTFWTSIERELARAADPENALPPEKKQRLLTQIRAVVNEWRPFVTEVTAIFEPKRMEGAAAGGGAASGETAPLERASEPAPSINDGTGATTP